MKTVDFTQHLLSIQTELFRFAFKLTADRCTLQIYTPHFYVI